MFSWKLNFKFISGLSGSPCVVGHSVTTLTSHRVTCTLYRIHPFHIQRFWQNKEQRPPRLRPCHRPPAPRQVPSRPRVALPTVPAARCTSRPRGEGDRLPCWEDEVAITGARRRWANRCHGRRNKCDRITSSSGIVKVRSGSGMLAGVGGRRGHHASSSNVQCHELGRLNESTMMMAGRGWMQLSYDLGLEQWIDSGIQEIVRVESDRSRWDYYIKRG